MDATRRWVAVALTAVWVGLLVFDAYASTAGIDYDVPEMVSTAMIALIGSLFAPDLVRIARGNGKGNGKGRGNGVDTT